MSQTILGLLIGFLALTAGHLNIAISHETIVQVATLVVGIGGLLHAWVARYKQGGIYWWGGRK